MIASALIGIVRYRYLNAAYKYLLALLITTLLLECAGRIFAITLYTSYPAYHILLPLQVLLYTQIYSMLIFHKPQLNLLFAVIAAICILLFLFNSLYVQSPLASMPSNGIALLSLVTVLYSLFLFYNMLQFPSENHLFRQPVFWFNSGNLIFYCITFFIFGFFNPVHKVSARLPEWQYTTIWVCNIILYSFYGIALLLDQKQSTTRDGHKQY